jgi:hypothetical protein
VSTHKSAAQKAIEKLADDVAKHEKAVTCMNKLAGKLANYEKAASHKSAVQKAIEKLADDLAKFQAMSRTTPKGVTTTEPPSARARALGGSVMCWLRRWSDLPQGRGHGPSIVPACRPV